MYISESRMVSELTLAEQTDLWHHMASLNLREEGAEANPRRFYQTKVTKPSTEKKLK